MKKLLFLLSVLTVIACDDETKKDSCPADATANAGADQTLTSLTTTLAANLPEGYTGQWTIKSGTGGQLANDKQANTSFTGLNGEVYVLEWKLSACKTFTDEVTINIQDNSTAPNAGEDRIIMHAKQTNLQATGTGIWTIVSGEGGEIVSPNNPISLFKGELGETYILRWSASENLFDEVSINFRGLSKTTDVTFRDVIEMSVSEFNIPNDKVAFFLLENDVDNGIGLFIERTAKRVKFIPYLAAGLIDYSIQILIYDDFEGNNPQLIQTPYNFTQRLYENILTEFRTLNQVLPKKVTVEQNFNIQVYSQNNISEVTAIMIQYLPGNEEVSFPVTVSSIQDLGNNQKLISCSFPSSVTYKGFVILKITAGNNSIYSQDFSII